MKVFFFQMSRQVDQVLRKAAGIPEMSSLLFFIISFGIIFSVHNIGFANLIQIISFRRGLCFD